jgi:2',3'-cyclic-nucleotide 2'-phosphodiesterase
LKPFHVLFIGDVVGTSGLAAVQYRLSGLKDRHGVDFTVLNAENASSGRGLTPAVARSLFDMGIDVLTSGNHIWNKDKIYPMLDEHPFLLRPLNFPAGIPGHGSCVATTSEGTQVAVINLQGRSFMVPIECPFKAADDETGRLRQSNIRVILVDFHAEATAEKIALGRHLDGRVSAVLGTHTHVQTADERVLPGGTAYITDVGMTGPTDSVIGMDTQSAILRFKTQLPVPYRASESPSGFNAVVVSVDPESGKSTGITRLCFDSNGQ